jgi:pilus assembly protein Flp/PilA
VLNSSSEKQWLYPDEPLAAMAVIVRLGIRRRTVTRPDLRTMRSTSSQTGDPGRTRPYSGVVRSLTNRLQGRPAAVGFRLNPFLQIATASSGTFGIRKAEMGAALFLKRFLREQSGATAIEYGLIVALIAVVIIVAVTSVGNSLKASFTSVNNKL